MSNMRIVPAIPVSFLIHLRIQLIIQGTSFRFDFLSDIPSSNSHLSFTFLFSNECSIQLKFGFSFNIHESALSSKAEFLGS
jgi:hypothetical protein